MDVHGLTHFYNPPRKGEEGGGVDDDILFQRLGKAQPVNLCLEIDNFESMLGHHGCREVGHI